MAIDFGSGLFLTSGLKKYYGLGTDAEIALIGHSHLMLGINKTTLEQQTGFKVAKYTREGVNVADREMMVDQLLSENENLKTVIYGVDAWTLTGEGLSENSYKLFYPFMAQPNVDRYIYQQASFIDYWQHKLIKTSRFNEGLISSSFRGFLGNWSNLKLGTVDTKKLKKEIVSGSFRKISSTNENHVIFERTLKKLQQHNIKTILLYVPTIDLYNNAEPEKFRQETDYFKKIDSTFSEVTYFELLQPYARDYSLFFDPIHLNPKGQEIITKELIKYITKTK